jgi:hypothetical protein
MEAFNKSELFLDIFNGLEVFTFIHVQRMLLLRNVEAFVKITRLLKDISRKMEASI